MYSGEAGEEVTEMAGKAQQGMADLQQKGGFGSPSKKEPVLPRYLQGHKVRWASLFQG